MRATAGSSQLFSQSPQSQAVVAGAGSGRDPVVHAMTAVLARQRPASAAEALRMLRHGYPDIPLALRIAALCAGTK